MISTILPEGARRVITPAEASEYALHAHQLRSARPRHTSLGPVMELRCSCGDLITNTDGDEAFLLFCDHGLAAVEAFVAQLCDPDWLTQLFTAAAALAPDDASLDGLGQQIAAYGALGSVGDPTDIEGFFARTNPFELGSDDLGEVLA